MGVGSSIQHGCLAHLLARLLLENGRKRLDLRGPREESACVSSARALATGGVSRLRVQILWKEL